jgi:hypothetical protein
MRRCIATLLAALMLWLPQAAYAAPWSPARQSFVSPAFTAQWARTDDTRVRGGGWYWGPQPWFDYYEFNRQSPNGLRLVQYFDKARMEINDPATGAVTNGLLVVEMVTGFQKGGDAPDDGFFRTPAYLPVAGDPADVNGSAPTYASFLSISTTPGAPRRDPDRRNQPISAAISASGELSERPELASAYSAKTRGAAYIDTTGHTIPQVFWEFLNRRGPVLIGEQRRTELVIDWVTVMGYPITDAYWVRARVGGQEQDVLVQLFERRVLTFTPANAAASRVEMGNVGQHYFEWRYTRLGRPWDTPPPPLPIFYASSSPTSQTVVFRMSPDGENPELFVAPGGDTLPSAIMPAYGGYEDIQVLVSSNRSDTMYHQLYGVSIVNGTGLIRMTYTDTTPPFAFSPYPPVDRPGNDLQPAISPDGTKVVFVSDRAERRQLFLMSYQGIPIGTVGDTIQLTSGGCNHTAPAWSTDGRTLVWAEDCDGDNEIMRADLSYQEDSRSFVGRYERNNLRAQLVNARKLTDNSVEDTAPRISPNGTLIAFQSRRDAGVAHIFTMDLEGGQVAQLTNGLADDITPAWSPEGDRLAFASIRDGDWEIYRRNADGTLRQLTANTTEDTMPVWGP